MIKYIKHVHAEIVFKMSSLWNVHDCRVVLQNEAPAGGVDRYGNVKREFYETTNIPGGIRVKVFDERFILFYGRNTRVRLLSLKCADGEICATLQVLEHFDRTWCKRLERARSV